MPTDRTVTKRAAVHTDARDLRDTDWSQIAALYDQLVRLDLSPIVRLNREIAVAELDGPEVAFAEIERLPLEGYHATHAHLLRQLGRNEESRAAYLIRCRDLTRGSNFVPLLPRATSWRYFDS